MSKKKNPEKTREIAIDESSAGKASYLDKTFLGKMLLTALIFVGAFYAISFFNAPKTPSGAVVLTTTGNEEKTVLDPEEVAKKVESYINENLLNSPGVEATVTNTEEFNEGLYLIGLDLKQNGKTVQQAEAYASKDGKTLFLGNVFDLTRPLPKPEEKPPQELKKSETPNIKMFVMSFCPYGKQAENGLLPVVELLGDKVEFEPHFVIYENYRGGSPEYCLGEGKYCSMHGINELNEDVRQLCIWKNNKDKWLDYVLEINKTCNLNNIEECWKGIAEKFGIDTAKISQCQESKALELLKKEKELNEQYSVRGSPTIFINEDSYSGGRTIEAFQQAVCSAFLKEPSECSQKIEEAQSNSSPPAGSCS